MKNKIRLAVFASGRGSNFEALLRYFAKNPVIEVAVLVCNNPRAGAIQLAAEYGIPVRMMQKGECMEAGTLSGDLATEQIDFLILAGFLWKIPALLVEKFRGRIINLHPALLPKYGGKGMYGHHVHEAVLANKEKTSGITIHQVDEEYDHGSTIFQASCNIDPHETVSSLAAKIHELEHQHFTRVVEAYIKKQITS